MALNAEELEKLGEALLGLLPADGTGKGNGWLIGELKDALRQSQSYEATDDDYWATRDHLVQTGLAVKGRGRGGSLIRVVQESKTKATRRQTESSLYPPFAEYVRRYWVKDNSIKDYVVQVTANQGKKRTGGKWTRPDITVIGVRTYTFIPGRQPEVVTFEIKPEREHDVSGVFETASHSVYAHKSYLAIACPTGRPEGEDFDRLEVLCKRFGVGLLIFSDVSDFDTYEELLEPVRSSPDPSDVDDFIIAQISKVNQNEIHKMLQ